MGTKKKFIAFGLLACIVLMGFFYTLGSLTIDTERAPGLEATTENLSNLDDADGDGVPNWEEELRGTDPNNPDTDGDNLDDGAEIKLGRNPLLAGPNDMLPAAFVPEAPSLSQEELTEVKQEFYRNFLKERGDEVREATVATLVNHFNDTFNEAEFGQQLTIKDVSVASNSSKESVALYANTLFTTFNSYAAGGYQYDETAIFEQGLLAKNPQELEELYLVAQVYKNISDDLLEIETPINLANSHVLLANSYDVMSRALVGMAEFFSNPVRGEVAYQTYVEQTVNIDLALYAILNTLDEMSITPNSVGEFEVVEKDVE